MKLQEVLQAEKTREFLTISHTPALLSFTQADDVEPTTPHNTAQASMGYESSATQSIVPHKAEKHEGMRRSPVEDEDDDTQGHGLVRTSAFRHLPSFLGTNKVAPIDDDSDDQTTLDGN